jgi:small subunit ribosomal protein S18
MAKPSKCPIAAEGIDYVDYKDVGLLLKYTTRYAKIKPRKYTGVSLRNQRKLARAIKRARYMGLLQYVR